VVARSGYGLCHMTQPLGTNPGDELEDVLAARNKRRGEPDKT